MKLILLTQGKFAKVDDEDYEILNSFKWCVNAQGYAVRGVGKGKMIRMHRVILGVNDLRIVDHINGDRLDNTRMNLRLCTYSQNAMNRMKVKGKSSKYKGVSFCLYKRSKNPIRKWRASISLKGKEIRIMYFDTEFQAAMVYDIWAKDIYGEFANLNFPIL